jgi:anti-sigma factor RsiW
MNHPSELLADLVDGTLDADARAGVDAHLATCATCREDLFAATAGREAARSLVPAPLPANLRDRIVATAGGRGDAGAPSGPPRWYRWAGVAAAAALIAVIAISLPEGGKGAAERAVEDAAAPAQGTMGAAPGVPLEVREDVNYGERDLVRLATAATRDVASLSSPGTDATSVEDAEEASDCIAEAFEGQPSDRLVRLIRARFGGRPAYLAVYLEGPGAGQEDDTAVVWVAAVDDCTVLSFAQASS